MRRVALWGICLLGLFAVGALLVPVVFSVVQRLTRDSFPEIIDRETFDAEIWQGSRVYDRRGELLAEFYKERRTVVPVESLPEHLIQAVVAAEDKNFYGHAGVDWTAVARAVVVDAVRMRAVQGASTLTQQLARNLYLSQERTLWRKVREMLLARKIEDRLDKQTILHQYLNLIYLGHGRYGVEEAAQFYFGKAAGKLTLPESAVLAGLIKGPEVFSPVKAPEKARARMEYVLRQMVAAGFLDEAAAAAVTLPETRPPAAPAHGASPYGVDAALAALFRHVDREQFDIGGYRVRTTLDPAWQLAMDRAIAGELDFLQVGIEVRDEEPEELCACVDQGRVPGGCALWAKVIRRTRKDDGYVVDLLGRLGRVPDNALERMERLEDVTIGLDPGQYVKVIPNYEFRLDSPWLTEEVLVVPVARPQVAAVLIEARSGRVRAVYGGVDHRYHPFNRALTARRQVGSTIKPFLYLAAMQTLAWNGETRVDARCLDLRQAEGRPWPIRDGHAHDDELTIEEALALSSNCAAVRTLRRLGVDLFLELWDRWGLPPLDTRDVSIALGSPSLSPLELASAYAMLVRRSCTPTPRLLEGAGGPGGEPVALPDAACKGTPPSHSARLVLKMLEAVLTEGTGKAARVEGIPAFGKTGTTSGGRDAWFAGVVRPPGHKAHVLVVWVGTDDFSPLEGNSGPTSAARLWRRVVEAIFVE